MDGADVCGTSSRASRRPPDVISAVAILDPRWRRRKWRHPGPGAVFSTPIAAAAQDGGPSASGRHLGWPHLRNRKWGHPRWRPEAEGPPSCAAAALGVEKTALYYYRFIINVKINVASNGMDWNLRAHSPCSLAALSRRLRMDNMLPIPVSKFNKFVMLSCS